MSKDPDQLDRPATQPSAVNRRIRVFVSSTFRDMMQERDELMSHTWPALRRLCRELQVELVEVDLRWGIAEEQSTRKETLKLCLDEIRACRPFFIGLLGERYGWVPGDDAFTADLKEEQPWLKDLPGKSVTELEILHGVLNNPEMAGRAFFYFRDPKYVESVPADRKTEFTAENAESAEKQQQLKVLVRTACTAKNIPLREGYPDPRQLAALVLTDLTAAITAQFPKEEIPDPLTREARDHEAFAEIRRRTYIGRPEYYAMLDGHAVGTGGPLVLLGESGSGKSALIANWLAHWRQKQPGDFIFQHYIGGTPDSASHWRLMTRLMLEIKRWTGDAEELPRTNDGILKNFPLWLARARAKAEHDGVRFILVLDALNQLEAQDHARTLGWLPAHSFSGPLRLIVSTLPGDTLEVVKQRGWASLPVHPLDPKERREMTAHYLARFGKKLDEARLARLAAAPAAANPLYLKVLLDELRVTGTHDRLDERLDDYLAATDIPALLGKVLNRYQRDHERDRPGLVGEALGLIYAARRGLTETELLQLLAPSGQSRIGNQKSEMAQLPLALWSPLRAALEEGLVDRGGILNFAHDFLRSAVESAFVSVVGRDLGRRQNLRLRLADYFEAQPISERNCDELPWLLQQTELLARLRACLLSIDRFLLIQERDKEELRRYWVCDLQEERTMGKAYIESFGRWSQDPGREDQRIARAAFQLAVFVRVAAMHTDAELLYRRALELAEQSYGSNHPEVATCLSDLALLLREANRLAEAEPLIRRALQIYEQSYGPDHVHVAIALNVLTFILKGTNRLAEAGPLYSRALKITEHYYGPNHPNVATRLNNLAEFLNFTGRSADAEPLYHLALKIKEQNYGPDHPEIVATLNNLAVLFHETNRLIDAEPLYRRALKIDEQNYGPDHPYVALDLNNLAQLLEWTDRLNEAEPLMQRALKIFEQNYGLDHPDVGMCLNNLAKLLEKTQRPNEAEPLMRRSLEIHLKFSRSSGHPHPHLEVVFNNYQELLIAMGQSHEQVSASLQQMDPELFAPQSPEESLKAQETIPDGKHPDFIYALNNHANQLRKQGRPAEAEPHDRRLVETSEKTWDRDHPQVIHRRNNLALTLLLLGKLDEARALLDENSQRPFSPLENLTPRIPFLQAMAEMVAEKESGGRDQETGEKTAEVSAQSPSRTPSSAVYLGRLKGHFAQPPLPVDTSILVPWDLGYFIEALRPKLPDGAADLFLALLEILNARCQVPPPDDLPAKLAALDRFPAWCAAPPPALA